jgi:hypothetical protein
LQAKGGDNRFRVGGKVGSYLATVLDNYGKRKHVTTAVTIAVTATNM